MSQWMPPILLCVFATHLPLFAWLYHRTHELRYAAATLTFVLLTVAYGLRIFAPELAWHGRPLHQEVRVVAWLAAGTSIVLLLHHFCGRLASERRRRRARSLAGDPARRAVR
jgi:hypothetical protein